MRSRQGARRRVLGLAALVVVSLLPGGSPAGAAAPAAGAVATPAAATGGRAVTDRLARGGTLAAGEQLRSPSGEHVLAMQTDGNLVSYAGSRAVWQAATGGHPGARAVLQSDGNLVVYGPGGGPLFATGTAGTSGSSLLLQDDGNLVLYGAAGPLWANYPRLDVLRGGQRLLPGERLRAGGGQHVLAMQGDGNLVVYAGSVPLWASGTGGNAGSSVVLQSDGNLVVYRPAGGALFSTGTAGSRGDALVVQDDGNLVLYGAGRPLWASAAPGGPAGSYALNHYPDGSVIRWNPCVPIGYKVNLAQAPAGALADLQTAVARVSGATGIPFTYQGTTPEVPTGTREPTSADLVVAWSRPGSTDLLTGAAGVGGYWWTSTGSPARYRVTGGFVVVDATQSSQWAPGFGVGVRRGTLLLHELAHVVGLDHVDDPTQVMHPTASPSSPGEFGAGDLRGLALVGRGAGCLSSTASGAGAEPADGPARVRVFTGG